MSLWIIVALVVVPLGAGFFLFLRTDRGQYGALGAVPMGMFLRATDQGATVPEAMHETIRLLRHRLPWSELSDSDLAAAVVLLAQLSRPKDFITVIVEVERTRSLGPITDIAILTQFIRGANRAAAGEAGAA